MILKSEYFSFIRLMLERLEGPALDWVVNIEGFQIYRRNAGRKCYHVLKIEIFTYQVSLFRARRFFINPPTKGLANIG